MGKRFVTEYEANERRSDDVEFLIICATATLLRAHY